MTGIEILEEIRKLTTGERLTIVEGALHEIREDIAVAEPSGKPHELRGELARAAESLLQDYSTDEELTGFTALLGGAVDGPSVRSLGST